MTKAQENLDQRNWNTVLDIAQAIPESLNLQAEVRDLRAISLAGLQAQQGTVSGLQEAISQAQQLEEERPLYSKAQALIDRWDKEIEDVKVITAAKQYANGGRITDLRAGMVKAEEVPRGNPRYQEARQLISQWNRRIQIIEDRPIINRAVNLARGRSIRSYQSAIAIASEISSNRALYREAQRKIASWQNQIERIEDRPILSEASNLASQGRLESAIEAAQQISSNRALYREAQNNIRRWRSELNARNSIQEASNLAEAGTLEALSQAIQTITPAQNSSNYSYRAERLVNRWSKQIYAIALRQADQNDLQTAINIAQRIPSQSSVYREVRAKIRNWQQELTVNLEEG